MSEPSDPRSSEIRPLSRKATRRLVVGAIIVAVLAAFLSAYLFVRSANDPAVQQRIEARQRQMEAATADSAALADSAATDTSSLAPAPEAP